MIKNKKIMTIPGCTHKFKKIRQFLVFVMSIITDFISSSAVTSYIGVPIE